MRNEENTMTIGGIQREIRKINLEIGKKKKQIGRNKMKNGVGGKPMRNGKHIEKWHCSF